MYLLLQFTFVVVMNSMTNSTLWKMGLFHLLLPGNSWLVRNYLWETQVETEAEALGNTAYLFASYIKSASFNIETLSCLGMVRSTTDGEFHINHGSRQFLTHRATKNSWRVKSSNTVSYSPHDSIMFQIENKTNSTITWLILFFIILQFDLLISFEVVHILSACILGPFKNEKMA